MSDNGHIARARKLGCPANRELVIEAVRGILRAPGCALYLWQERRQHAGFRLRVVAHQPIRGRWLRIGSLPITSTVDDIWRELDHLARGIRETC